VLIWPTRRWILMPLKSLGGAMIMEILVASSASALDRSSRCNCRLCDATLLARFAVDDSSVHQCRLFASCHLASSHQRRNGSLCSAALVARLSVKDSSAGQCRLFCVSLFCVSRHLIGISSAAQWFALRRRSPFNRRQQCR